MRVGPPGRQEVGKMEAQWVGDWFSTGQSSPDPHLHLSEPPWKADPAVVLGTEQQEALRVSAPGTAQ